MTALTFHIIDVEPGRTRIDGTTADGAVACTLTIDRFDVNDGHGGTVTVDGIGNVETDPGFRNQGLASRLMEHAVSVMRERGADVSTLYGIDHFYHRWGYEPCGDEHRLRLLLQPGNARSAAGDELPDGWSTRAADASDIATVLDLYARATGHLPGTTVRTPDTRSMRRLRASLEVAPTNRGDAWPDGRPSGSPECTLVLDPHGEPAAYAWLATGCYNVDDDARRNRDDVVIGELHARDAEAADVVIRISRACARAWNQTDDDAHFAVWTSSRPGHIVHEVAVGNHHCETRRETRPAGGLMALVLNPTVAAPADWHQFLPDHF